MAGCTAVRVMFGANRNVFNNSDQIRVMNMSIPERYTQASLAFSFSSKF